MLEEDEEEEDINQSNINKGTPEKTDQKSSSDDHDQERVVVKSEQDCMTNPADNPKSDTKATESNSNSTKSDTKVTESVIENPSETGSNR